MAMHDNVIGEGNTQPEKHDFSSEIKRLNALIGRDEDNYVLLRDLDFHAWSELPWIRDKPEEERKHLHALRSVGEVNPTLEDPEHDTIKTLKDAWAEARQNTWSSDGSIGSVSTAPEPIIPAKKVLEILAEKMGDYLIDVYPTAPRSEIRLQSETLKNEWWLSILTRSSSENVGTIPSYLPAKSTSRMYSERVAEMGIPAKDILETGIVVLYNIAAKKSSIHNIITCAMGVLTSPEVLEVLKPHQNTGWKAMNGLGKAINNPRLKPIQRPKFIPAMEQGAAQKTFPETFTDLELNDFLSTPEKLVSLQELQDSIIKGDYMKDIKALGIYDPLSAPLEIAIRLEKTLQQWNSHQDDPICYCDKRLAESTVVMGSYAKAKDVWEATVQIFGKPAYDESSGRTHYTTNETIWRISQFFLNATDYTAKVEAGALVPRRPQNPSILPVLQEPNLS